MFSLTRSRPIRFVFLCFLCVLALFMHQLNNLRALQHHTSHDAFPQLPRVSLHDRNRIFGDEPPGNEFIQVNPITITTTSQLPGEGSRVAGNDKPPAATSASTTTGHISQEGLQEQGWRAQAKADGLDVRSGNIVMHIIGHTHLDPGWLQTFEQYYQSSVSSILDTLITALEADKKRRFSWVEICYLDRWWRERDQSVHERFRRLWKAGQIEFVMGGWVSNDEACVNYLQAVNHLTEGHRWLRENIDPSITPRTAWQIDPFGLSEGMAALFAEAGFEAHAGWRISEPEMRTMMDAKQLEFVWRGSKAGGEPTELLMHLLPWSYTCPGQFLFESNPGADARIPELAEQLVNEARERAKYTRHAPHVMWLWGHDFHFKDANTMFRVMDKLIAHVNSHPDLGVTALYSTPGTYFSAVHESMASAHTAGKGLFPIISKDFLPYQAGPVNWWTGYFTSRPHLKRTLRVVDALLRAAEQSLLMLHLDSIRREDTSADTQQRFRALFGRVESARRDNGILQHHDAITGTMRKVVLQDYYKMADSAVAHTTAVLEAAFHEILTVNVQSDPTFPANQHTRLSLLSPALPPSSPEAPSAKCLGPGSPHTIAVYNPLAHTVQRLVEVPLCESWRGARVLQVNEGKPPTELASEVHPRVSLVPSPAAAASGDPRAVLVLAERTLLFAATLAPLGTHTYTIEEVPSTAVPVYTPLQTLDYQPATGGRDFLERGNLQELLTTDTADSGRIFTLWNDHIEMHFTDQGAPKRYVRKAKAADAAADAKSAAKEVSRREWYLRHDMMYYSSDGSWANQYTFRSQQDLPARPAAPIARGAQNGGGVWVLIKGRLRSELLVQETDAIARRYRVDQFADFVEVVDQISPDVGVPADWVSRWQVQEFNSDGPRAAVLHTDPSGILRTARPMVRGRAISGNYFPGVYSVELRHQGSAPEEDTLLCAIDTPEGVSSPVPGSIERMLHRVAYQASGNGERLDEGGFVAVTSRILLDTSARAAAARLRLSMELNFPPVVMALSSATVWAPSVPALSSSGITVNTLALAALAPLTQPIEPPLFLATLAMHNTTACVVRVAHADEEGSVAHFDMHALMVPTFAVVKSLEERTLTLLSPSRTPRKHWHVEGEAAHEPRAAGHFGHGGPGADEASGGDVWHPAQIRSWFVDFAKGGEHAGHNHPLHEEEE